MKQVFDFKSSGFVLSLVTVVLSLFAVGGLEVPNDPTLLVDFTNTLSGSGLVAAFGILAAALARPLLKWVQSPRPTWKEFWGSAGTWIALVQFGVSLLVIRGIGIPEQAGENVVGAIYAKDYLGLVSTLFIGFVEPIARWFINQRKKAATEIEAAPIEV